MSCADIAKGLPVYRVRWLGYSEDEDSWIDESDLQCVFF